MSAGRARKYERDGYIVVRGLYSQEEMLDWKKRIVGRMEAAGWQKDPSGVKVWMLEDLDPFFKRELAGARIAEVLAELVGSSVEFLSVKPVFKNSSVTFGSPWHHDWAYWKGSHKISVWIALDRATPTNGCLKMIPGSHKKYVDMDSVSDGKGFGNRLDEEVIKGQPVNLLEVDPGDVVFFHDLTLHASCPNSDGSERWSFIATYRDGSVRDDSTVWQTSMPLHAGVG